MVEEAKPHAQPTPAVAKTQAVAPAPKAPIVAKTPAVAAAALAPKAPTVARMFPYFEKWSTENVKVSDLGLSKYLNLDSRLIPHSYGIHVEKQLGKKNISIVERLINKVMRSGQGKRKLSGKYIRGRGSTGKKMQAMHIIEDAFILIEKQTRENPVQVFVKAIENAAPREDITRIARGGMAYTVAVDVAPLKRVDESLKNLALAAFAQSFNNKTSASEALAKELILASKGDGQSFAIKRRDELERIAKASR